MRRLDEVIIDLRDKDKILLTRYKNGTGFSIHNTGWCVQMSRDQAVELAHGLLEITDEDYETPEPDHAPDGLDLYK